MVTHQVDMHCESRYEQTPGFTGGQVCLQLSSSVSVTHLQQQDELREALDGFDHQAVQSDPVWTGSLFLLKAEKRPSGECQTGISSGSVRRVTEGGGKILQHRTFKNI